MAQDGTIMAASTSFTATITGQGGHGAMPHLGVDPVVAAAAIVQSLQPLVSRETDPTDSLVISTTRFNTGRHLTLQHLLPLVPAKRSPWGITSQG